MGNIVYSQNQRIDVKDVVQTAREHFESILQESNGNLYGAQLEVAFIEMLKNSSNLNTKFGALLKENAPTKAVFDSRSQAEEEPAATKLINVNKSQRLSQIIIIPEEVDNNDDDGLKEAEEIVNLFSDNKINLNENKDIFVDSFEIVRNRNSFKFLVAVDGHTESEIAFQVAMSLKKATDHIELLHIYSESDQNDVLKLSKLHRQKAIYTKYDTMVATSHVDQKNVVLTWISKDDNTSSREVFLDHLKTARRTYHVHIDEVMKQAVFNDAAYKVNVTIDGKADERNKKVNPIDDDNAIFPTSAIITSPSTKNLSVPEKKSITASTPVVKINCAAIMEKCQHPVDFVVLGHTGRKATLKQNNRMLNSVVNFALHEITTTVILANTAPNNNTWQNGKKVVMAVNESESSKRGLSILLTLIHPNDTLILIFADNERENTQSAANAIFDQFGTNKVRQVQSYYEKELAMFGPKNSSFIILNVYASNAPEQIESICLSSYISTSLSSKSQLVGNTAEELIKLSPRSQPPSSPIDSSRVQFSARTSRYKELKQNHNNGTVLVSSSARDTRLCLTARDEPRSTVSAKDFHSSTATNLFSDNSSNGESKPKVPVLSFSSKVLGSETLSFLPPISSARKVHTTREGNDNTNTTDDYTTPRKPASKLSSTAQAIVDYINVKLADSPPDYFAIAPRARSAVISYCYVTESIISQLDCNIIICKDSK